MKMYLFATATMMLVSCNNDNNMGTQNTAPAVESAAAQPARAAGPVAGVSANSANKIFTLRNESSLIVTNIYVSPATLNNWSQDLLQQNVIPPGENAQVTFPAQQSECLWDVKLRTQNGSEQQIENNNICTSSEITYR